MSRPPDLRHREPEVRKERIKLIANGLNAVGVALVIGSSVAPIVDPSRHTDALHVLGGFGLGVVFIVAAIGLLRYMLPPER